MLALVPDPGSESAEDKTGSQKESSCPNKWNPYHECSAYCARRWDNAKVRESLFLVSYPITK